MQVARPIIRLLNRLNHPAADLWLPQLAATLPADVAAVQPWAQGAGWRGRYLLAHTLGRSAQPNDAAALTLLRQLAQDNERFVREGTAAALAACLSRDAAWLAVVQAELEAAEVERQRTAALAAIALLKLNDVAAHELGLTLLVHAAAQPLTPALRPLAGLVQHALPPERAAAVFARWEAIGSETARWHAGRWREEGKAAAEGGKDPLGDAWTTTAEIATSTSLLGQVIGQDNVVEVVRLAAQQRRFLLLVGEPGTGKSLLAAALAELLPTAALEDVLVRANPQQPISPKIERVAGGTGSAQVAAAQAQQRALTQATGYLFGVAIAAAVLIAGYYAFLNGATRPLWLGGAAVVGLLWLRRRVRTAGEAAAPKLLVGRAPGAGAPFVDATGAHAGALFGDVRHDPFQSGGVETPPHLLVEAGAIHQAHGGVLFIDEVSTLSWESQQVLLTAIQEKQLPISGRSPLSSGAMIRTEPVPCDFTLVVAGNLEDIAHMHPALRSRVRGFGYELLLNREMANTAEARAALARFVAQEVGKDGRIPHFERAAVDEVIAAAEARAGKAGVLTTRLRELGGLVRAAGDLAVRDGAALVTAAHVVAARPLARPLEEQMGRGDYEV